MGKRLTRQEKLNQLTIDLINKMFEISDHDVTYEDIKDRKDEWYTKWTMTVEQGEKWRQWGEQELKKRLRINSKYAKYEMAMFSLNYGLTFSNLKYGIE
jgi:hypothetical protein